MDGLMRRGKVSSCTACMWLEGWVVGWMKRGKCLRSLLARELMVECLEKACLRYVAAAVRGACKVVTVQRDKLHAHLLK